MNETEIITQIQSLKAEWDALQPLKPADEERLWQKFRLEWNFNSNHIEGNTLTYGETELLFLHDQTTGNHSLREYEEMKAHDVAIAHIRNLAREKRDLLETDIRDLNKLILKEPFWKEAQTPDGQPTRKRIVPGEYKSTPNNVRTATGELFQFADPIDVPARMQDLVNWLRNALNGSLPHLDLLLHKVHYDFVLIHPFDDGNGRVARLLVNYVLLRLGYPPIIIKSADKKNYLAALRKADVGDRGPFSDYLLQQLKWSLELGIKAANGESIEEPSDVEKEIALLVHSEAAKKDRVKKKSWEMIDACYEHGWKKLLTQFDEKTTKIRDLFESSELHIASNRSVQGEGWKKQLMHVLGNRQYPLDQFSMELRLKGYVGDAPRPFNLHLNLQFSLSEYDYEIRSSGDKAVRKLYSEYLLSDEAETLINSALKAALDNIKQQSAKRT